MNQDNALKAASEELTEIVKEKGFFTMYDLYKVLGYYEPFEDTTVLNKIGWAIRDEKASK